VREKGEGQGGDECFVTGLHLLLPLAVLAQFDRAGVEAVWVARDGVAHAELDLAVAGERELDVLLSEEPEDVREALARIGDEVLVADPEVFVPRTGP
jgi:hypothetical protein